MGSGFEFFVFYFYCVALCLILSGLYLIIKRFVLRHNGTPVTIVSILPRVIKEIPFVARGMDKYIYGYDIKYILNGETHTAESVEFYIPFAPTSGPMVQFIFNSLLNIWHLTLDYISSVRCFLFFYKFTFIITNICLKILSIFVILIIEILLFIFLVESSDLAV